MPRIRLPSQEEMTPEQALVCGEVISGVRGKVPAPMIAWLKNPELARRGQLLGELLRFNTSIDPHLSEMAILICGRHWTSHHEWTAHKKLAIKAGLDSEIIEAIAARRTPIFPDEKHRCVYELSIQLLTTSRVAAGLYKSCVETLGEIGVVELVGILGYYCMVSLTLNAFELGLPENYARELHDPASG